MDLLPIAKMNFFFLGLSFVAVSFAKTAVRGPSGQEAAEGTNIERLRNVVTNSELFRKKVAITCSKAKDDSQLCIERTGEMLFCQLLSRTKPDLAAEAHCGHEADKKHMAAVQMKSEPNITGELGDVKKSIMESASFHDEASKLAKQFGCSTVKKKDACTKYVADAAFCLAMADHIDKFQKMDGTKDEVTYCAHIDEHIPKLSLLMQPSFMQLKSSKKGFSARSDPAKEPANELAKEMTHDLEMNFNKIAPFGKEDTAKELQDHAAKTQDTLVDAVENAEVAEIKRAVFRALTRLRAATIKEFDTIARLETQAIDAYNDAHHYRSENPLAHLHEDEAPVETDKLKSFH